MEKEFDEKESIRIINEMIAQTQGNIQIGTASPMIFCGYFTCAIALLEIILMHVLDKPAMANWVWLLTIPMQIISRIISNKIDRSSIIRTPIDRIVNQVWIAFSISVAICLSCIFMSIPIMRIVLPSNNPWVACIFIMPVLLLLTGMGEYITGYATRFKPFMTGGFIFWIGALVCFPLTYIVFKNESVPFIILIICMITGFILPGHSLNRKADKNV